MCDVRAPRALSCVLSRSLALSLARLLARARSLSLSRARENTQAREEEVESWKSKHAADTQKLRDERGVLESNLCDEIARHVVTNGHLDKVCVEGRGDG